jgi:hypothetical protein
MGPARTVCTACRQRRLAGDPAPPDTMRAVLEGAVNGATLVKELSLQDGHPFVYQRHLFIGGSGACRSRTTR